jgi:hypothetical protein
VYDAVSPANTIKIQTQTFKLFPNPADEFVEIKFDALKSNGRLSVFDVAGKEVFQTLLLNKQEQIKIQTSDLMPGIYLVTVTTELGRSVQKLVIQ